MPDSPDPSADTPSVRTILFVCTGNTCRSPMAQAIAEGLLAGAGASEAFFVASAGVSAMPGSGATPEAVDAAHELGYRLDDHRSAPLSPLMVEKAHAVFGLTRAHVEAIRALAPDHADAVQLLDPQGHDVPDPIGQPGAVYLETARHLRAMIAARLRELGVEVDAEATT
jgi:L-threonylcarbamoyladenylate synthase